MDGRKLLADKGIFPNEVNRSLAYDGGNRLPVMASVCGSYFYGLADEESDLDVRGIFMSPVGESLVCREDEWPVVVAGLKDGFVLHSLPSVVKRLLDGKLDALPFLFPESPFDLNEILGWGQTGSSAVDRDGFWEVASFLTMYRRDFITQQSLTRALSASKFMFLRFIESASQVQSLHEIPQRERKSAVHAFALMRFFSSVAEARDVSGGAFFTGSDESTIGDREMLMNLKRGRQFGCATLPESMKRLMSRMNELRSQAKQAHHFLNKNPKYGAVFKALESVYEKCSSCWE